ncbi:MAG: thiamine diphosphokinase [Bacteroidaceae bacterium]|nr:thiamine diphosphokinase [Bacteroidaceae bacterium]
MDIEYDAVILADGSFPVEGHVLDVLNNAKYLCCCDSAGMEMVRRGRVPDAIVGDGDSMTEEFMEEYRDIIHIVSEQEYNDLTKSTQHVARHLRKSISDRPIRIAYLGCTGKREDHTLGNISLMAYYMQAFSIEPYMLTDYGIFMPASGTCTFPSAPRIQVSIFNMDCTELSSTGLRWASYPYRQWWQGTLNEAVGDSFTLCGNGTYIVYQTYLPKTQKPAGE